VKLSFGSLVVEAELETATGPIRVAVKRLRSKTNWKAVLGWFRRGRASQAWYRGHALLARGIPTARPLVVYESRGWFGARGYLVTEWLTDAHDVHAYAWDLARRPAGERRLRVRQAAETLGRLIRNLHDQGFTHRDLKANNLLLRETPEGLAGFLIDLDGLRQGRVPQQAICAKNLARLALSAEMHPWISRTDRLRCLRAYVGRREWQQGADWKTWWRDTAKHVKASLAELYRAGRQVT